MTSYSNTEDMKSIIPMIDDNVFVWKEPVKCQDLIDFFFMEKGFCAISRNKICFHLNYLRYSLI